MQEKEKRREWEEAVVAALLFVHWYLFLVRKWSVLFVSFVGFVSPQFSPTFRKPARTIKHTMQSFWKRTQHFLTTFTSTPNSELVDAAQETPVLQLAPDISLGKFLFRLAAFTLICVRVRVGAFVVCSDLQLLWCSFAWMLRTDMQSLEEVGCIRGMWSVPNICTLPTPPSSSSLLLPPSSFLLPPPSSPKIIKIIMYMFKTSIRQIVWRQVYERHFALNTSIESTKERPIDNTMPEWLLLGVSFPPFSRYPPSFPPSSCSFSFISFSSLHIFTLRSLFCSHWMWP